MRFPLIALILVFALVVGNVIFAQESREPSEIPVEIVINNQGYPQDKRAPVRFPHQDHAKSARTDFSCDMCHHDYQNGKNIWTKQDPVKRCAECHPYEKKEGQPRSLRFAYHANCRGCHMSLIYQNIARGMPAQKCEDCHKAKE
jgi:hypothetical protein